MIDVGNDPLAHYNFVYMSSSSSTLNDDADCVPQDVEKPAIAPKDQPRTAEGPTKEFIFFPIPRYLRHIPGDSIEFHLPRIFLLSISTIFLVANMSYCQPLLIQMAKHFDVSYITISEIPTFIEAGYATGLFFVSPLGDILKRRQLILALIFSSASLTVGFALTSSFLVLQILAFFIGLSTIAPQIIIALTRDHAHPSKSSFAYSIILSGYLSGILLGRLFSGVIAEWASWHFVFYFAFATQYTIFVLCYFTIPDCPAKNNNLSYTTVLWTMLKYAVTEPAVVQIELVSMALGAAIANYSVTLTFLLGGAPYYYSELSMGLFGLTEITGIVLSPVAGRLVDAISPWTTLLISAIGLFVFQAIQTAAGGSHLAALIIACIGLDSFRQLQYISMAAAIYRVSIEAVSRLNALLVLSYCLGQLIGTSAGSILFVEREWRASAAFGMAWYGLQIAVALIRGPHCKRREWVGY